jgi:hypothetical protein
MKSLGICRARGFSLRQWEKEEEIQQTVYRE